MSISSIRFAGIKDNLVPNEAGKQHVPHVKSVYALKPGAIKSAEPCAQGAKIQLQDDSFAYVHPYDANVHNRIGANKLAKLLQFDISPKVKAISIPESLSHDKPRPTSLFGTIVDWIDGPTFKKFSGMASPKRKQFDQQNLTELYLFYLISQDSDFHNRNIIVKIPSEKDTPVKLFAIDNEKTGANPLDFIAKLKKYPAELKKRVAGKTLPGPTLVKLQHFVDNKSTGAAKLKTYFPDEHVENSYKIAQYILELGKVPTEEQVTTFLKTLQPQQEEVQVQPSVLNLTEQSNTQEDAHQVDPLVVNHSDIQTVELPNTQQEPILVTQESGHPLYTAMRDMVENMVSKMLSRVDLILK
jgi:hypothetical protein